MVIKKSTTKVVSKKAPSKKTLSKGKKLQMKQVSGDLCFWVNNGPILSNLMDLYYALRDMSPDQFNHHVANNKNDFAVWVGEVLCEKRCSSQLHKAKTKKEALKVVEDAIKAYV